ncbi:uncharacterized protein LOC135205956 [Macrobrachium nipponense]|uniref:uncharacterized protein LOC135205956 n=1 Tax=Macrobrachium nipponense TaxID=159736 RepID=UPI0030C7ACCE
MHSLQNDKNIGWDTPLSSELMKEWAKIAKQVNKSSEIVPPRSVGNRCDEYNLLVYTDTSKELLGCALYLVAVNSADTRLILAKNSVLCKKLRTKSIPVLELISVHFGVKTAVDVAEQLMNAVVPIRIRDIYCFTDSMIVLSWIKSKEFEFGKIDRKQMMVNNRLNDISTLCSKRTVIFDHIGGDENPSDCLTRCVSEKMLRSTLFLTGPKFLDSPSECRVIVPHPGAKPLPVSCSVRTHFILNSEPLIPLNKFSSFSKAVKVLSIVFIFVTKLKQRLKLTKNIPENTSDEQNETARSTIHLLVHAQKAAFPQVYDTLATGNFSEPLISQLNLFRDESGLIRVQSKLCKLKAAYDERCPILLGKNCPVARSIIWDTHVKLRHAGIYKTLGLLRKRFWIINGFVVVKKVLKGCLICKRLNARTVKINQNAYRDFRINQEAIPFRNICIDHCGPFLVKDRNKQNYKVYVLVISCFWSRAINLVVCRLIDKNSFLRALQMHIFEYGFPSLIVSDNGSPIVAGVEQTISYLNDLETIDFLRSHNIKSLKFHPFPANAHKLGGFVETMVKQVKRIVTSSIRNYILDYKDFQFLIAEAKMLVNKRPVAFRNARNKLDFDHSVPVPLTPKMIVKGYEVPCVSIIPELNISDQDESLGVSDDIFDNNQEAVLSRFGKIMKVKANLEKIYQGEFTATLFSQATDRKNRYGKKSHIELRVGDLVSIKTDFIKPFAYPLGIIVQIEKNDLNEVTSASVRKSNGEILRHVDNLIFLTDTSINVDSNSVSPEFVPETCTVSYKSERSAARRCRERNKALIEQHKV